jgi:Na+-transporting NADH:ubiquinone oxidoreductase subunit F
MVFSVIIFGYLEEAGVVGSEKFIIINNDPESSIRTSDGNTLLSSLAENGIYLPSACGGRGICGTCKCAVKEGGGEISPAELRHIDEIERKDLFRLACQIKVKKNLKIDLPDEILSIKKYVSTVISNENVAPFIKELILKLDEGKELNFKSGAYIQIDIPGYELSFKKFSVAGKYLESWNKVNL